MLEKILPMSFHNINWVGSGEEVKKLGLVSLGVESYHVLCNIRRDVLRKIRVELCPHSLNLLRILTNEQDSQYPSRTECCQQRFR